MDKQDCCQELKRFLGQDINCSKIVTDHENINTFGYRTTKSQCLLDGHKYERHYSHRHNVHEEYFDGKHIGQYKRTG